MKISTGFIKKRNLFEQFEILEREKFKNLSLNAWFNMVNNEPYINPGNYFNIEIIEGGWCDFINENKYTNDNISKQVELLRVVGSKYLRLFFGVANLVDISNNGLDYTINSVSEKINKLCDKYPDVNFVFENHGLASNNNLFLSGVCNLVEKKNFGLNFDYINLEVENIDAENLFKNLYKHVKMMHIKGRVGNQYSDFKNSESRFLEKHISNGFSKNIKYCIEHEGPGEPVSDIKFALNKMIEYGYK